MVKILIIIVFSILLLGACTLPLKVTSWTINGVSYVATEKTITDHGLSAIAGRDCAITRAVLGGPLCQSEN
jgi:major membrane immunogen (membrane-anchored lipoprotein)